MNIGLTEIKELFRSEMERKSLSYSGEIIADGEIHRFHVEGDKPHKCNGWYVLYTDGTPSGAFGSWKLSTKHQWRLTNTHMVSKNHAHLQRQAISKNRIQRDNIRLQQHTQAAIYARRLWSCAKPASKTHPYLVKKRVHPHNLYQLNELLYVPIIDIHGNLQNLQIINTHGDKKFLRGGQIQGLFSLLGEIPSQGNLYICEGWATAATIYENFGSVVAAMNAGNLKSVALSLSQRISKEVVLIIAADNDRYNINNPGLTKAKEAAQSINARIILPRFCSDACKCTDFNDLHNCPITADGVAQC